MGVRSRTMMHDEPAPPRQAPKFLMIALGVAFFVGVIVAIVSVSTDSSAAIPAETNLAAKGDAETELSYGTVTMRPSATKMSSFGFSPSPSSGPTPSPSPDITYGGIDINANTGQITHKLDSRRRIAAKITDSRRRSSSPTPSSSSRRRGITISGTYHFSAAGQTTATTVVTMVAMMAVF